MHLHLDQHLMELIELAVCEFENVEFGETLLESMPDTWQQEYRKTINQPLRHVPLRHRPELSAAVHSLVANEMVYEVIYRYFSARPILKNIRILYSQNSDPAKIESQQFHRDPEGSKQVKLFVAVRDVSIQSGPLTVISRADSELVISREGEHIRYTDEVVQRSASVERWHSCVGSSGTAWLVDTSNCLHFGSRQGTRPRILIYAQILPWYSAFLPGRNPLGEGHWLNKPPKSDHKLEHSTPVSRQPPTAEPPLGIARSW